MFWTGDMGGLEQQETTFLLYSFSVFFFFFLNSLFESPNYSSESENLLLPPNPLGMPDSGGPRGRATRRPAGLMGVFSDCSRLVL